MKRVTCVLVACLVTSGLSATSTSAQTIAPFDIGVQVSVERIGELDATDAGIGVRAAWHALPLVGIEGEIDVYPSDVPDALAVSGNRAEGLFGVTAGPQFGKWRPFARVRPGFLRIGSAPEPVVCPLIFPPTLSCNLAAGTTLFAFDLGGGVEWSATPRTFLRVDIGDRMLRYSGPAIDREGAVHDNTFVDHDLRLAFGAGWRF